jgi:hypothetical protein
MEMSVFIPRLILTGSLIRGNLSHAAKHIKAIYKRSPQPSVVAGKVPS